MCHILQYISSARPNKSRISKKIYTLTPNASIPAIPKRVRFFHKQIELRPFPSKLGGFLTLILTKWSKLGVI